MKSVVLFLACIFLVQQIVAEDVGDISEDFDGILSYFLENAGLKDEDFSNLLADKALELEGVKTTISPSNVILTSIPQNIPSNAVRVNRALGSVILDAKFVELHLLVPYNMSSVARMIGSGQTLLSFYNVSVSGLAGISESETVTDMFLSYSAKESETELLKKLKPYLDNSLKQQLNRILKDKYYSQDKYFRSSLFPTKSVKVSYDFDSIVDSLLSDLRQESSNRVDIPYMEFSFSKGYLHLSNGYFEGITTIHRISSIVSSETGETYQLVGSFGVTGAKVGFDYQGKYSIFKAHGTVTGQIGDGNSETIHLLADTSNGKCVANFQSVTIDKLEDISIKLTGFGAFNGLASKLATNELNKRKDQLISELQDKLNDYGHQYITNYDCSDLIPK